MFRPLGAILREWRYRPLSNKNIGLHVIPMSSTRVDCALFLFHHTALFLLALQQQSTALCCKVCCKSQFTVFLEGYIPLFRGSVNALWMGTAMWSWQPLLCRLPACLVLERHRVGRVATINSAAAAPWSVEKREVNVVRGRGIITGAPCLLSRGSTFCLCLSCSSCSFVDPKLVYWECFGLTAVPHALIVLFFF
jgi:hypothetical protein